jgi:hypothetical protein
MVNFLRHAQAHYSLSVASLIETDLDGATVQHPGVIGEQIASSSGPRGARRAFRLRNRVRGIARVKRTTAAPAFGVTLGILVVAGLVGPSIANSEGNLRCPGKPEHLLLRVPSDKAPAGLTAHEARSKILALWQALDPGTEPSLGPLGCPLGRPVVIFNRVRQAFQRGYIYVAGASREPAFVVAVRGLHRWFLWWGPAPSASIGVRVASYEVDGHTVPSSFERLGGSDLIQAASPLGGHVVFLRPTSDLTLFVCLQSRVTCDAFEPSNIHTAWQPVTKRLPVGLPTAAPFDLSARLNLTELQLQLPAASSPEQRLKAALPPWLPCFATPPVTRPVHGEDALADLQIMMRRGTPCPLTGETPADSATSWLGAESHEWPGHPGTQSGDFPCERLGDLDPVLLGVLHILYEHPVPGPARGRLIDMMEPFGGSPRDSPYADPGSDNNLCPVEILETENHILMQETARYLINDLLGEDNQEEREESKLFLLRYLQLILHRDLYEYNSLPYGRWSLKPLYLLHDHAPDPDVRTAARGVLDWIWAKFAVGENMRRSSRPYRRRPDPKHYEAEGWLSDGTEAVGIQSALLLGGGLNYLDWPLNVPPPQGETPYTDFVGYPQIGSFPEGHEAAIADVMDADYRPPPSIASWFVDRYSSWGGTTGVQPPPPPGDEELIQYVQLFNHTGGGSQDLTVQRNEGQEIYAGSRSFTITAGGSDVGPGLPPAPPRSGNYLNISWWTVIQDLVFLNVITGKIQADKLWDDQPGIMRETALVPSGGSLTRSQTLRFAAPHVAVRDPQPDRLCVSAGFMCGFDFRWPANPFPGALDANTCPAPQLPANPDLKGTFLLARPFLGCLLKTGKDHQWRVWTFPRGEIAFDAGYQPVTDAPWIASWVEDTTDPRRVFVEWEVPPDPEGWFRVYGGAGNPDDNEGDPLAINGRTTNSVQHWSGQESFALAPPTPRIDLASWRIRVWGCDEGKWPHPSDCKPMLHPLQVDIQRPPRKPFFCEPPMHTEGGFVGRVCSADYPMYAYILNPLPCGPEVGCTPGAADYGFVIAAPARQLEQAQLKKGLSEEQARTQAMTAFGAAIEQHKPNPSGDFTPLSPNEVFVPFGTEDAEQGHVVTFQWTPSGQDWAIQRDDGPFEALIKTVGPEPLKWPLAIGGAALGRDPRGGLISASGDGCFSIDGLPRPGSRFRTTVDMRNPLAPTIDEGEVSVTKAC